MGELVHAGKLFTRLGRLEARRAELDTAGPNMVDRWIATKKVPDYPEYPLQKVGTGFGKLDAVSTSALGLGAAAVVGSAEAMRFARRGVEVSGRLAEQVLLNVAARVETALLNTNGSGEHAQQPATIVFAKRTGRRR